ncbi:MAG: glycoside hydrolase family 3 C-terminal domain-containing protein, partial [Acidobacteria bacterium]|nr:glycoside hydrolase family 3 C-terminal domain-containing protein [Acidobacteriota bacterium]
GDALDGAIEAARGSDVAIVVVGYTADDEGEFIGDPGIDLRHLFPERDDDGLAERFRAEQRIATVRPEHVRSRHGLGFSVGGDRSSLQLAEGDEALIRAVAAANARTVVVLQAGSAVIVAGWVDRVPAVVQAWYGGQQAGHGLADVLFGAVTPSARLPFTVPSDPSHLPHFDRDADAIDYDQWHGWWRAERLGLRPQYPFGYGLSYTTFEISGTSVEHDEDRHRVSCTVSNTGRRDGADVVQVYARYGDDAVPSRLVGFRRVEVPAGASVRVTIDVPRARLARRDPVTKSWRNPDGPVELVAARHAPN